MGVSLTSSLMLLMSHCWCNGWQDIPKQDVIESDLEQFQAIARLAAHLEVPSGDLDSATLNYLYANAIPSSKGGLLKSIILAVHCSERLSRRQDTHREANERLGTSLIIASLLVCKGYLLTHPEDMQTVSPAGLQFFLAEYLKPGARITLSMIENIAWKGSGTPFQWWALFTPEFIRSNEEMIRLFEDRPREAAWCGSSGRMVVAVSRSAGEVNFMTCDGDELKRSEIGATTRTTLVWDGSDYLQGRT